MLSCMWMRVRCCRSVHAYRVHAKMRAYAKVMTVRNRALCLALISCLYQAQWHLACWPPTQHPSCKCQMVAARAVCMQVGAVQSRGCAAGQQSAQGRAQGVHEADQVSIWSLGALVQVLCGYETHACPHARYGQHSEHVKHVIECTNRRALCSDINTMLRMATHVHTASPTVRNHVPYAYWLTKPVACCFRYEDENTRYIDIGPVNKVMNMLACWLDDPHGEAFKKWV